MSRSIEAVRQALLGVAQDKGCNAKTIGLVHEAISIWETIENDVCGDLKKQLAERDEIVKSLVREVEGCRSEAIEQAQKHAAFVMESSKLVDSMSDQIHAKRIELHALQRAMKRQIHFDYDPETREFIVTFRNGNSLRFEKIKSIVGNVDGWLSTLRYNREQDPE